MISATFDLQVTSILQMNFLVNCPFGSGEKVQNRFSTGLLGRPSWISNQNNFTFLICKSSKYFLSSFQSTGLSVQEKKFKIEFQDSNCGGHLVFQIE